ncbi:MAG: tRNA pseudouridine(38-40) synthase TruA [Exilispira sp.]
MENFSFFNYLAYISYNGFEYSGFQIQKKENSVQNQIEQVLYKLNKKFLDENEVKNNKMINNLLRIQFAGRTDAKVHAIENVISFSSFKKYSTEKLIEIFNNNLPVSIRFNKIIETDKRINPRYLAVERVYIYIIYKGNKFLPFIKNFVYHYKNYIDIAKMKISLSLFNGTHNFINFTTSLEKRNPVRTIYDTKVMEKDNFIFIIIRGNSFLHKQVRFIIGTSLLHATNKIEIDYIKQLLNPEPLLKENFPKKSLFVVPAEGLYLAKVRFQNDPPVDYEEFNLANFLIS